MHLPAVTKGSAPHTLLNRYLWVSFFDSVAAALQSSCLWCSVVKRGIFASESARPEKEAAGQRNSCSLLLQGFLVLSRTKGVSRFKIHLALVRRNKRGKKEEA